MSIEDNLNSINENLKEILTLMKRKEEVNQSAPKEEAHVAAPQYPTTPVAMPTEVKVTAQPVQIPVAQESFTREQIAVAMSNAMTAGKQESVHRILDAFNVQTLMDINPANYNQIAIMLRAEGVQIWVNKKRMHC